MVTSLGGLTLHEASSGKYVVLPKGTRRMLDHNDRPVVPVRIVRGQPAIKLSLP